MIPVDSGKHCDSCCKTVVDFTSMNKFEIQQYFIHKKGSKKSICGHFKSTQVNIKRPKHHQFLVNLYFKIEKKTRFSKLQTIGLSAIVICMGLVGCNQPVSGEVIIENTEESSNTSKTHNLLGSPVPDSDSVQHGIRMGKVVKEKFKDSTNIKTCSLPEDSTQTFNVLMGEVSTPIPAQIDIKEITTGEFIIEE